MAKTKALQRLEISLQETARGFESHSLRQGCVEKKDAGKKSALMCGFFALLIHVLDKIEKKIKWFPEEGIANKNYERRCKSGPKSQLFDPVGPQIPWKGGSNSLEVRTYSSNSSYAHCPDLADRQAGGKI